MMPIRPRYMECDQQGVVFNAWYLVWFDEAFTAWMGALGYSYDGMVARGIDVQNVHAELDYLSGVRWGDEVGVHVSVVRIGTKSFTLGYEVRRSDQACVQGQIVYAVVRTDGSGAIEIPEDLLGLLREHAPPR